MDQRFVGKVALVTGAASGIGKAVALRLAAEGGAVACLDLNAEGAAATAAEIEAAGGKASSHACNVAELDSVRAAVGAAVAAHGGTLHVACNVAGIGHFAKSQDETLEWWNRILAVNLTGTFLVSQAVFPYLKETKGVIINTASTAGVFGQPWSAAYSASKGGVALLTRALATEWREFRIRVNAVAPGGVDTPITSSFSDVPTDVDLSIFSKIMVPWGMMQPSTMASLFAYAASDEADFMTGSILVMDGGMTA